MDNAPKLADFGDKAWPRGHVLAVQKDMSFPRLQAAFIEMARRLVDQVAAQVQDGVRHDVSAKSGPLAWLHLAGVRHNA